MSRRPEFYGEAFEEAVTCPQGHEHVIYMILKSKLISPYILRIFVIFCGAINVLGLVRGRFLGRVEAEQ